MSNVPTPEQVKTFIQTYGPVLYMHPEEQFLATSVGWFLENAGQLQGSGANAYFEKLKPEQRKGDLRRAKPYIHVKEPVGDHVEIQFWIFYAYNGPGTAKLPILPDYEVNLAPFGEHGGDWEHFTFRVDLQTMQPTKVWLAQHGDGKLHDYGDLKQENGRPVLYASRNGHATYHDVDNHVTDVVLLNVTGRGHPFDTSKPEPELLDVSPPDWLGFEGRWGPKITYTGEELDQKVEEVHNRLSTVLKFAVSKSRIEEAITSTHQNEENGPTGPRYKSEWLQPETD